MMRITLRLPHDVPAHLAAQAEKDRRSINAEIVHLIEMALNTVSGDGESP